MRATLEFLEMPVDAAPPGRVLGVDPGTRMLGWGVVEARGDSFVHVASGEVDARRGTFPERLRTVHEALTVLVKRHRPSVLAIEDIFFGVNAKTLIRIGEGRGVVLLVAAQGGLPVVDYPPALVRRSVLGHGGAHKPQVQRMVQVLLGLPEPPASEHAADALAVALCHLIRGRSVGAAAAAVAEQGGILRSPGRRGRRGRGRRIPILGRAAALDP